MKKLLWAGMALGVLGTAPAVVAEENWSPHLPGVDQGLAAGALPPPGTYFINSTLNADYRYADNSGTKQGTRASIFVDVPIILWNPGVQVLGADYSAALAQPFTHVDTLSNGSTVARNWGLFETIAVPGMLSWSLPNDFHVKTGLAVYIPDGTAQKQKNTSANGTYAGVANSINYWSLEPSVGLSWLHDGWNIGAELNYDYNFKNTQTGYTSGDVLVVDYTLTKTIGPWTVGLGGYSVNQLEDDKSSIASVQSSIDANGGFRQAKYAAGPILGYNFGPFAVTGAYNHAIGETKNTVNGDSFWTRVVVPF
ncbi:MAG TPA: transporter [Candidatus Sulfotelmatobacter sp.]|jgi:hypothetical protein|nr:transporter [Candidatus Sulfotelmatobacter sp.]